MTRHKNIFKLVIHELGPNEPIDVKIGYVFSNLYLFCIFNIKFAYLNQNLHEVKLFWTSFWNRFSLFIAFRLYFCIRTFYGPCRLLLKKGPFQKNGLTWRPKPLRSAAIYITLAWRHDYLKNFRIVKKRFRKGGLKKF